MISRIVLLLLLCIIVVEIQPFKSASPAAAKASSGEAQAQELQSTASKAAGVFRSDAARQARPELRNVIVVTAANVAYSLHIENFSCWMRRLGFHALVFSLDPEMHKYALSMATKDRSTEEEAVLHSYLWGGVTANIHINIKRAAEWRTPAFHAITTAKLEVVLSLLRLQYDVLFVDTDVALIRDPFPYLMWKNVDMAYSVNQICPHSDTFDVWSDVHVYEGNTGLYFIRSTSSTIRLYDLTIEEARRYPKLDEQTIFWTFVKDAGRLQATGAPAVVDLGYCRDFQRSGLVRSRRRKGKEQVAFPYLDVKSPEFKTTTSVMLLNNGLFSEYSTAATSGNANRTNEIVICPLDGCVFSAGGLRGVSYKMLEEGLKWRGETSAAIHANFLKGSASKAAALRRHGLWLHYPTEGLNLTSGCMSYEKKSYREVQKLY